MDRRTHDIDAPSPSSDVVVVEGLRVRYGTNEAVRGIDLRVERGEVLGLIGPDGAGKTSTLRVIAGLQPPGAGRIEVLGRQAWSERRALHREVGYLAQRFALYGDLSVDENARVFGLLYGIDRWQERRTMLLQRVGLDRFRGRQADHLSGGMRQKLALACSLMHGPRLLLLDEPTTGVDPVTRREFWRLLAELVAEGLTLVVATPYLDEAERCSRVVLLHRGRVLADDPPWRLVERFPGTLIEVSGHPREVVAAALGSTAGVTDVQPFAARFHARLAGASLDALRSEIERAGATVDDVRVIAPGLEDAFLHLVRADAAEEVA